MDFKKILAPTDLSEPSFQAVRQAMQIAQNHEAELTLLRVLPESDADDARTEADVELRHLDDVVRDYAPAELSVDTSVRRGDVIGEIRRTAKEGDYDLIVMSTHGVTGWREFTLGSITGEVVRTAPCPVLTISREARK